MNTPIVAPNTATPAAASTDEATKETPKVAPGINAIKAQRKTELAAAAETATKAAADKAIADAAAVALKAKEDATKAATEADTSANLKAKLEASEAEKATLRTKAEQAAILDKVKALQAEGKYMEALQELDPDILTRAAAQAMGMSKEDQEKLTKPKASTDPELLKRLEELEKGNKSLSEKLAAKEQAEAAAAKEQAVKAVQDHVKEQAKDYPWLSRNPKWVAAALVTADEKYAAKLAEPARKGADLTQEEKTALINEALKAGEEFRANEAKEYGATATPATTPVATHGNDVTKPTLTFTGSRAGTNNLVKSKAKSVDELKKSRRASAN